MKGNPEVLWALLFAVPGGIAIGTNTVNLYDGETISFKHANHIANKDLNLIQEAIERKAEQFEHNLINKMTTDTLMKIHEN